MCNDGEIFGKNCFYIKARLKVFYFFKALFLFLGLLFFSMQSYAKSMSEFCGKEALLDQELKTVGKQVLFVGGLNFEPLRFSDMQNYFLQKSYDSSILFLETTGRESLPPITDSTTLLQTWREQVKKSICEKGKSAKQKVVVAYSLGGLLVESLLQEERIEDFENWKFIYIAPALNIKSFFSTLLNLSKWLGDDWKILSVNLKDYRAKSYTRVGEYLALKNMNEFFWQLPKKELNVSQMLIYSEEDELIDSENLKLYFQSYRKTQRLKLFRVLESKKGIGKNHLIVDFASIGLDNWQKLLEAADQFLEED